MNPAAVQYTLMSFYDLDAGCPVDDFLITDHELARCLDPKGRPGAREKLLVCEERGDIHVSLYVDESVCSRMHACRQPDNVPLRLLDDFCLLIEGVSHFVYLCWHAHHGRGVTLLEMELQAEVDKYVALTGHYADAALGEQGIHNALFEDFSYDPQLEPHERQRYEQANHYAAKYCQSLERRFNPRRRNDMQRELCRFYRKPQAGKLRMIEDTATG